MNIFKDASPLSIGSLDFDRGIRRLHKSLVVESREPQDVAFRDLLQKELKLTSGAAVGSQCRKILTDVTTDDVLKTQVDLIVERVNKAQLS